MPAASELSSISDGDGRVPAKVLPPHEARLVNRRVRATDLEGALAATATIRIRMQAEGRSLIASSWRSTSRGVTMELVFSDAGDD